MSEKRVLIVEDERPIASLLAKLVERCGVQAETAHDGKEGLEKLRANKPDLLLLDLIMPIMSGEEVLRELQADPELASLPVIVISTKQPNMDEYLQVLYWVQKPFQPSQVKQLVCELLQPK